MGLYQITSTDHCTEKPPKSKALTTS